MRLGGGLVLAAEQVSKDGCHSVRLVGGGGGSAGVRSNSGIRGKADMSDTGSFIDLGKVGAATKQRIDSVFIGCVFPVTVRWIFQDIAFASLGRDCGGPQNQLHHRD